MKTERPKLLRRVLIYLLVICVLLSIPAKSSYGITQTCNPTGYIGNCVDVSPGKYSQKLGVDFPNFASVKLSYPTGAILVNSVGDLLFNITLNPLMLNPLSAQVGSTVLVAGSGFSSTDTTCSLSGGPVGSPTSCTIAGGTIAVGLSFVVANVPAGVYTITATGNSGDFSSSTFTVLPPSLVLNPSSGPIGTTVKVSGFGFYTTAHTTCDLTGGPVSPIPCTIAGGTLNPLSFVVPLASPSGTYSMTVTTDLGDTGEATASFAVTSTSQYITLTPPPYGHVSDPVSLSGSGFLSPSDNGDCSLSGRVVSTPTCTISGGTLAAAFTVANVASGVYTITATGSGGDSAMANFQVLPSPPSVPISTVVSIDIYVPPDFTGLALSKTWSSFTNNYDQSSISLRRQSGSDPIGPSWWKISLSNLTVTNSPSSYSPSSYPLVAHRIFIVNRSQYIRLFQVTSPIIAGRYFFKAFVNRKSIGASNFPTLIVKGSRDPAYISGVLRDLGDRNASRAGQNITLPPGYGARVLAIGLDYLGRPAEAQAFINSTANGSYTIFGVAPGTYNITAYAAGYIPTTRPWTVSVLAAQSLNGVDIYMSESAIVTGTVLSLCDGAPIPWGTIPASNSFQQVDRSISVQVQTLTGTVVAQTPINTTFTNARSTTFVFPTIYRELGLDGRIPQDFANYTSGLTSGDYLVRAYVASYVQLTEVRIHILNATSDAQVVIPLIRTGQFFVTVHFRNSNTTIVDDPTTLGGSLTVSAYDQEGIIRAQNSTFVPANSENASVALLGFSRTRTFGAGSLLPQGYGLLPGTYHIVARFTAAQFQFFGGGGSVQDLYYQLSDVQATIGLACNANVSLSFPMYLAGGILLSLYPITYQKPPLFENWRYPNANVRVTIEDSYGAIYQASTTQGNTAIGSATGVRYFNFSYVGLLPGNYVVFVQTLGYTQAQLVQVGVRMGATSDAAVYMIENPVIDLTVAFTHEALLTFIDSTLPFAQPINNIDATPTRVEVFDDRGTFLAANATYIPNLTSATDGAGTNGVPTTSAHFVLAGFDTNTYSGDPRLIWSGFYDTTDGASQNSGGLILYPWSFSPRVYTVRIWIDGYYQLEQLQVTITPPKSVSVVALVDRASRISGTVIGPDFFDFARPLSWATITLQPNNFTLTSIIDVRPGNYTTSSLDGFFQVWVPEGSYGMGVSLNGYSSYSAQIAVPSGSDLNMYIWLDNYQGSPQAISEPLSIVIIARKT
ncbi:MAG: hypothetical protein ABSD49_08705 [Candidatus Bathyarchaeia archaeon]